MGRDIGHIQFRQRLDRGGAVVIGRPPHHRKPAERDQRIDCRSLGIAEEGIHGGAGIQPTGEGGDHGQTLRLEPCDDGIVMGAIRRQDIGPQQQKPHSALYLGRAGEVRHSGGDALRQGGVIQPDLRVIDRRLGSGALPFLAGGIAAHQEADHLFDIVVRPAQPILHRQEPSAQVLRLAGDEAQDLGQAAQHGHLVLARA